MWGKKFNPGFTPLASSTLSASRLRLDLDCTVSNTKISSDSSGQNNNKHLDFAYNEYIQSLAKKRIISTTIKHYETLLQQQIDYQNNEITKMRNACEKKKTILDNSIRTNELVKILQELELELKEFEKLTECQSMKDLTSLSNILGAVCRELMLVGVKTLSHKEEWLSLLKTMNECSKFLQKFFQTHETIKEFELIDEISMKFKETLDLQTDIQEQIAISSSVSKQDSIKYLEKLNDLFDMLRTTTI